MINPPEIEHNEIFSLAEKWVNETSRNIFLTGKAGTGKTTFLKHIKETTHKNTVVLAPTGIAAINAGGSTLHSFFRLPFGTFLPVYTSGHQGEKLITQQSLPSLIRYTRQHIHLIRAIELLIIDEVSMVRADLLDMVDAILKRFRFAPHLPFGGVQVLFIGDMHQLPPVVKEQEARILAEYYNSPFFFDSKVLRDEPPVIIQLEKIYRQQETDFLELLNELRHNKLSQESYDKLLSKVTHIPPKDDRYITLTSHVAQADRMNERAMSELPTPVKIFKAKVDGDFPEHSYPAATELALKKGARVMFIKNDPDKRFFNGKTGKVLSIKDEEVEVLCDDGNTVHVAPIAWLNVKYGTNADTGKVEENVLGKFWQIPLRLAWAVTIHKSQGLTFDKVVIDAERSFAAGQVYVALSRCRTWEGIVLLSQIKASSLLTDINVVSFGEKTWKPESLEKSLPQQRHSFQTEKIEETFDLKSSYRYQEQLQKLLLEFESSFSKNATEYFKQLIRQLYSLSNVAENFSRQIHALNSPQILPEENEALQKRLIEAATYFSNQNQQHLLTPLQNLPDAPDNTTAATRVLQLLESVREEAYLHQQIWLAMLSGFSSKELMKTKAKALQEATRLKALKWLKHGQQQRASSSQSAHPALEHDLKVWRTEMAELLRTDVFRIISNKAIDGIITHLPLNKKELLSISGIGNKKVKEFGDQLLEVISRHFPLKEEEEAFPEEKKIKKKGLSETYNDSLVLFRSGMDIEGIAKARNYAVSTIAGHFAKLIAEKEISIHEILPIEKQNKIRAILSELEDVGTGIVSAAKEKLGEGYDWNEIKWVLADKRLSEEAAN